MGVFSICICTYKRPECLALLLSDLATQTVLPEYLIIVDGDPASREVRSVLHGKAYVADGKMCYIPSDHPNLPYQRYLGWNVAKNKQSDILLYLDDDLRAFQADSVEKIINPILDHGQIVVGVTGEIRFSSFGKKGFHTPSSPLPINDRLLSSWVALLGSAARVAPGELSPSGHRKLPIYHGHAYAEVKWLRGGVMAFAMSALSQDCFSNDLFALDHIRCGLGEDTFLSRRVGVRGKLWLVHNAIFEHPLTATSYPTKAFQAGYAAAYSRRFLNDHYRPFMQPTLQDRLALVKSYIGTTILNWWAFIKKPKTYAAAYTWGYMLGALRGVFQKPTSNNLTPHINWQKDAELALTKAQFIQEAPDAATLS